MEYRVYGINHIQVDIKHGLGFPEGVKAILRMDPDYVMLGEIRDAASAEAAVVAASSGRPLLSTIHSRDATGVIDVLRNFKLNDQEISSHLVMVVAQRLVRMLCLECRKQVRPTRSEQKHIFMLDDGLSKVADGVTSLDELRGLDGLSAFQAEYERLRRF